MLRVAVVEDLPEYANMLKRYAERYAAEKGLEAEVEMYAEGRTFLEQYRGNTDVVLMDIGMPGIDGMECARRLREKDDAVPLIFVTSMAQYAIRGYEVDAMAFMVKPVSFAEFSLKMDKAVRRNSRREGAAYTISSRDVVKVLEISRIIYIEVFNHSLVFHTDDGDFETYGRLAAIEEDERFSDFVKVSKSHLVNGRQVTVIGEDFVTAGGSRIPLSRRRRRECIEKIAQVMGGR